MKKTDAKRIGNIEEVSQIVMHPTACVKCQLGQDWYKCDFEVLFIPAGYYPNYLDVERYVKENIDGHELNIEQAARLLYDFLLVAYEPKALTVYNKVKGCKSHFDVEVQIGG